MTRIGELLIEQGKLRQDGLTRALAERPTGVRLASLLVSKGLVSFDDASRALGIQKGVPSALAKHLDNRDPALASLIPAALGRSSHVLPIGENSTGALVVCARDPSSALLATLRKAVPRAILLIVAPAQRLEELIASAYGAAPADELDIDFDLELDVHEPAAPPSLPRTTRSMPPAKAASTPSPVAPPPPRASTAPPASPAPARAASPLRGAPPPRPRPTLDLELDLGAETPPPPPDMAALAPESLRIVLTDFDGAEANSPPPPDMAALAPESLRIMLTDFDGAETISPPPPDMAALAPESLRIMLTELDMLETPAPPAAVGPPPLEASMSLGDPLDMMLELAPPLPRRVATSPVVARTVSPVRAASTAAAGPARPVTAEPARTKTAEPARTKTGEPSRSKTGERPPLAVTSSFDATQTALSRAPTRDHVVDHLFAYIAGRWSRAMVLKIREQQAVGYRGHGVPRVEAVALSLAQPSTIVRAIATRRCSSQVPGSAAQDMLSSALGSPSKPTVAPVIVAGEVIEVIAVGDPLEGQADLQTTADLAQLAALLSAAYERLASS